MNKKYLYYIFANLYVLTSLLASGIVRLAKPNCRQANQLSQFISKINSLTINLSYSVT